MLLGVFEAGFFPGAILKYLDGANGWQWLFLVQGLPAALMGVLIFVVLKDKPADAPWLTATEKNMLARDLAQDAATETGKPHGALRQLLRERRWHFVGCVALAGLMLWIAMRGAQRR